MSRQNIFHSQRKPKSCSKLRHLGLWPLYKLPHIEFPHLVPSPMALGRGLGTNLAALHTCISVCSSQNGKKARASSGNYGPWYGKLCPNMIMQWKGMAPKNGLEAPLIFFYLRVIFNGGKNLKQI